MKYIFSIFLICSSLSFYIQAKEITSFDKDRSEIKLREKQNTGRDKAISIVFIEAWIDNTNDQISVVGSGLKDTFIYILDTSGNAVEVSTAYFGDIKEEHLLSSPALPGRYWLIIDSPVVYAEGTFLVQ